MPLNLYFLLLLVLSVTSEQDPTLLFEWVSVDYVWENEGDRQAAIDSGDYQVENNLITGVKSWQGVTYVTVPRWLPGVPSTLNTVSDQPDGNGGFLLSPFPSWEMNNASIPSSLQYVQSMEIDNTGRMWIIDCGRLNIFGEPVVNGPARMVIINLNTNEIERTFIFPHEIARFDSNFLNDIVVDSTRRFAYISDASGAGAMIIYDYNTNMARRWEGPGMSVEDTIITINGVSFPGIQSPMNGMALTPDGEHVYYSALTALSLWTIPAYYLRDFSVSETDLNALAFNLGNRDSQADGIAMDSNGRLYLGQLSLNGVVSWDREGDFEGNQVSMVPRDNVTMQFPDTFGFDNQGNLLFTTNRLQLFFNDMMNFTGADANMRIFSLDIGANSYNYNMAAPASGTTTSDAPAPTDSNPTVLLILAIVAAALLIGAVAFWYYNSRKKVIDAVRMSASQGYAAMY